MHRGLFKSIPICETFRRRNQALAVLDAIVSPDWTYRYYSFDSHWPNSLGMGSMRDGSGNYWYEVSKNNDCALVLCDIEIAKSENYNVLSCLDNINDSFRLLLSDPAFQISEATQLLFSSNSEEWLACEEKYTERYEFLLRHIIHWHAEDYVHWAAEYYESDLNIEWVEKIYRFESLTREIASAINPNIDLDPLADEVKTIGYPSSL